jgi:sucrose-6-phosphate hydrolase SacC (GH32 family)
MTRHRALWLSSLLTTLFVVRTVLAFEGGESSSGKERYNKAYRPQFHFSPARNWMNDPDGTIYY